MWRFAVAVLLLCRVSAHETLPVFLADNHAETFGWVTRTFDLDQPHLLVLVDAHSDASATERSEEVRELVRRVPNEAERAKRVEKWRAEGRLQAFNWIEPLMPRPFSGVLWINGKSGDEMERAALAGKQTDGRLEVEPRGAGEMKLLWRAVSIEGFEEVKLGEGPVILSVDLDTFAGMERAMREGLFRRIWTRAMDLPGLVGVSFSVSRPWLTNNAEADELVALALRAVAHTRGAILEIDGAVDDRIDLSLKAAEFENGEVPRWDLSKANAVVHAWMKILGVRCRMVDHLGTTMKIVDFGDVELPAVRPTTGEVSIDGVWRAPVGDSLVLRAHAGTGATGKVRWHRLVSARDCYDLWPETGLGKSFSNNPGRWIYEKADGDAVLTEDFQWPLASESVGCQRWFAEVEMPGGWIPTAVCDVRFSTGSGFRAALSECFEMPYVFGVSYVNEPQGSGVVSGWGSDCTNFLIYAWRRNGVMLPWGDPGMLRKSLRTLAEGQTSDDGFVISDAMIAEGLVVDFGKHVAAVWEDKPPLGVLDGGDLIAHHLGGRPEIIPLNELAKGRPKFAVRVLPDDLPSCRIRMAGDVVLAGQGLVETTGFEKGDADFFMGNLEGVAAQQSPAQSPRYDFRFSPDRLKLLKTAGVDLVSAANNHAGDAGIAGLLQSIAAMRATGIAVVGAGADSNEACEGFKTEMNGVKVAVFGVSLVSGPVATEMSPGIAHLPEHAVILEQKMREARSRGHVIFVITHWGDEYRQAVNDQQREWSIWLIDRGARVIFGAGPHVNQSIECHDGAAVFYSLGNAVYPRALKGADSGSIREVLVDALRVVVE